MCYSWAKTHPITNYQVTQIVRLNYPACMTVTRKSSTLGKNREFANFRVFYIGHPNVYTLLIRTIPSYKRKCHVKRFMLTNHQSKWNRTPSLNTRFLHLQQRQCVEGTSTSAPAPPSAADSFAWLERSRKASRKEPQLQPFSTEHARMP